MLAAFAKPVEFPIPEKLIPFVKTAIHGESQEKLNLEYPMFATGFPILIYIQDPPTILNDLKPSKSADVLNLAGQIYDANVSVSFMDQEMDAIGVILSPLAPYYLFHKKGTDLLNKWIELSSLNLNVGDVRRRLESTEELNIKVAIIYSMLKELIPDRLPQIKWLEAALNKIFMKEGHINIQELYDTNEISPRHFRRKFKEIIGMPPKYYCKVIQMNSVFRMINKGETEKLNHIALDCGYFDQAHFINDFKKRIGFAPTDFLNSKYSFLSSYLGVQ